MPAPLSQLGPLPRWLQAGIFALVLAGLVVLIYRLYRLELHSIRRAYAISLLALRLTIIAIVFLTAGFKPIVRMTTREEIPSHVLIAIDRSESMNIADVHRDATEKLQLARGLKIGADLVDDKTLLSWMAQLRQLDPPRNDTYRRLVERVDGLSRKEIASRVLAPQGADLLQAVSERHQLHLVGFSQQLGPLPASFEMLRSSLFSGKNAGDAYTDLKLPLKYGQERREKFHDGLVGIVVLSDGQHNWGNGPGELAYQLGHTEGKTPLPVYTVVCGAKTPPPDLAIASVKASPALVFKHGDVSLDVRLQASNLPPGRIRLTVAYPEVSDLPTRKPIVEVIDFDGVNQPPPRSIPVKMDRAAQERLVITAEFIAGDGSQIVDRFPENNVRHVVVQVVPDRAKVLLVDGEARWELHYLQTALRRDQTMDSHSVVFDQPRLKLANVDDANALHLPDMRFPGPDDLLRNDCIILGDVSPQQLPPAERMRLEKYVADSGGTLVILAGKRSMPMEFLEAGDPFARMLPITHPHVVERTNGFQVALTGDGMQTGFLRLENDAGASEQRSRALPAHYWGIVGKAKSGATALAYVPSAEPKALAAEQKANALVVRQNYGFGRVVFIGLDSTWRWRFKQGDKYHHRFWSQLIRWAAGDRALIAGNDFVRFGVREPTYRSDQEIEMLVRLGDKVKKLSDQAVVGMRHFSACPGGQARNTRSLGSAQAQCRCAAAV